MGDVPLIGLITLFVWLGIMLSNELGYKKFNLLNQSTQSLEVSMKEAINLNRNNKLFKQASMFENVQMSIVGVISSQFGAFA
ncbi:hypothetical protein [Acinetobacter sp. WY4]|uniref:hypothetical protein n=1 Tax=Acinetobacter sp. WY4 TaxID=2708348 RepID=UPI001BCC3474|nr:hypothetical protein [Acinetobacter sp. WY4]